jgi:hypothetical protein
MKSDKSDKAAKTLLRQIEDKKEELKRLEQILEIHSIKTELRELQELKSGVYVWVSILGVEPKENECPGNMGSDCLLELSFEKKESEEIMHTLCHVVEKEIVEFSKVRSSV